MTNNKHIYLLYETSRFIVSWSQYWFLLPLNQIPFLWSLYFKSCLTNHWHLLSLGVEIKNDGSLLPRLLDIIRECIPSGRVLLCWRKALGWRGHMEGSGRPIHRCIVLPLCGHLLLYINCLHLLKKCVVQKIIAIGEQQQTTYII